MKLIVVGAGIAGLSTAWAAVKVGHQVTLIEQGPIPNPLGASGDEHRIIRRAYGALDGYARTITEAFAAWDELWADIGTKHYAATGVIAVSQRPGDEADIYRAGLDRTGFPYERCSPTEMAARYPFLDAATIAYGYVMAEGGVLLCQRIAADMVAWLSAHGADVRPKTSVASIDAETGTVEIVGGGRLSADRIVVTAGAWLPTLFPDITAHLTPYRTAVAYLEPPADLKSAWEGAPAILDVGGDVDGYVLPPVAGTRLKVGAGIHKIPASATDNRTVSTGEGIQLRDYFSPPFARIEAYQVLETRTCAYIFTKDERFWTGERGRCLLISACSGHGYKFGAAVGRRAVATIESGDMDGFRSWIEGRSTS